MTINYRLSDVDAAGATIRARATAPEAEQEFIIHPGHSFQVRYGQLPTSSRQRRKQPRATWPEPTAQSALAGLNTPGHNDNQYSEPTYMRHTCKGNALRRRQSDTGYVKH